MRTQIVFAALAVAGIAAAAIGPDLARQLAATGPDERIPVCIALREQFDPARLNALAGGLDRAARRLTVAQALRRFSRENQAGLVEFLSGAGAEDVRQLWIVNAVHCEATADVIRQAAVRPEVGSVETDRRCAPGGLGLSGQETDTEVWGLERIGAPEVWSRGFLGQGVVVAVIGTGCDYTHPDFEGHLWDDPAYPNYGWDFEDGDDDPMDETGHGTFTAGCVASNGRAGTACGVAPEAQVMALKVKVAADSISEAQCWEAIEFAVSPPQSPEHGAHVYVLPLGWTVSWGAHQALWRQAVSNTNAAGLAQVTFIGADQTPPPPLQARCPGNVPPPWWNPDNSGQGALAGMIAAGATDSLDQIASFSAKGPVTWMNVPPYNDFVHPPGLTKPEVSAPGVSIKSCALGGGYAVQSGVSWAAAYTTGTLALMLSADTTLLPSGLDSILELTAVDLGPSRKDNSFGAGRIDALAAVLRITGVDEGRPGAGRPQHDATVARGSLGVGAGHLQVLLDISGRIAMYLRPGANDVSRLEPGVYFLRGAALAAAKLVVLR
ncbi:hypothetical protein FJY71_00565 [candidate division WOR-3 bacterium]|nr:hypothetical protein [candidate division WOR-3 bacterium]